MIECGPVHTSNVCVIAPKVVYWYRIPTPKENKEINLKAEGYQK